MKIIILLSFFCLFFGIASCNNENIINKQDDKNEELISDFGQTSHDFWGIGILSDNKCNSGEMLNFPDSSINIYDRPNGNIIGMIYREPKQNYGLLIEIFKTKTVNKINNKDYIEVTYEGQNIKYYQDDNGFINCLIHTIDSGVWIKKDKLENLNFKPFNWKDFLIERGLKMHPPYNTSIPLFDSSGQFTDSLKYGDFEMILIDKNGHPNVFYYSRGC